MTVAIIGITLYRPSGSKVGGVAMDMPKEDGVYIYNRGEWRRVSADGPFVPKEDGVYVYYFRNRKCPGCKSFDSTWLKAVDKAGRELHGIPVIVQCTNFFIECGDESAKDTFILFLVTVTPQIMVLVVENSELRFVEREYGPLDYDVLIQFVNETRKRMESYLAGKGMEQEESEGEGIYIELSGDWKRVVEKLKRMLFEGKNLREICDESGCRIYVE